MHVLWLHGSGGWLERRRYLGQNQEQPVDIGEFDDVFQYLVLVLPLVYVYCGTVKPPRCPEDPPTLPTRAVGTMLAHAM